MAPKIDPGGFWKRLWPQDGPRRSPRSLLGASGGEKKTLDAPEGAPRKLLARFLPPSKLTTTPGGGGKRVLRTSVLEFFA